MPTPPNQPGRISPQVQKEMEEAWALRRDAVRIMGVVVAEWRTDPMSVACFDLRLVKRATEIIERLDILERRNPFI